MSVCVCADRQWGRCWQSIFSHPTSNFWRGEGSHWFLVAMLQNQAHPPLTSRWPSVALFHTSSVCFSQRISRTSQGTKPLFFPLATRMKPLCSPSLLTQIWGQRYIWKLKWILIKWDHCIGWNVGSNTITYVSNWWLQPLVILKILLPIGKFCYDYVVIIKFEMFWVFFVSNFVSKEVIKRTFCIFMLALTPPSIFPRVCVTRKERQRVTDSSCLPWLHLHWGLLALSLSSNMLRKIWWEKELDLSTADTSPKMLI